MIVGGDGEILVVVELFMGEFWLFGEDLVVVDGWIEDEYC